MEEEYQARDNTGVVTASSDGASIRGMMPRKGIEVKRPLFAIIAILVKVNKFRQDFIAAISFG